MTALQQHWPASLPPVAAVAGVPFHPQEDYQCGPAALAMAAGAAGQPLSPKALVEQVYLPARKGSLQLEMLAAGRRHGLLTYPLQPELDVLLQEVAAGHPAIVLQNLSLSFVPVWHYAVVIGYDRQRNTITLHSGTTEKLEMSLYTFERTWARGGNWSMLVLSPERLPASAEADRYAAAAAALERVHPGAARKAYASALERWPDHRALGLGAGNAAYALHDIDAAIEAYRRLTNRQPDYADGWNNLAQALLDRGRFEEARKAVEHAIELGGPRLAQYRALLMEIEQRG